MVKAYLRYDAATSGPHAFGVIASNANILFDHTGKHIIASALENVCLWNVKQGTQAKSLSPDPTTSGTAAPSEVTQLAKAPTGTQLAVGYADGSIRLWDLRSGECVVTLKGHKGAVSALRYNRSGALLASGSKDTDVIVWDVAGEAGLFRLRGHKDQVTDLVFLSTANALVTCSKDSAVRVWDLETQHCSQTVVGHKGEVWSLDVDPSETRLVTGSTDCELRMYAVAAGNSAAAGADGDAAASTSRGALLETRGSVRRRAQDRAALVRYDANGGLLLVQSAGKQVEVFKVRSAEEAKKKMKRRKKRKREKKQKKGGDSDESESEGEEAGGAAAAEGADVAQASDELEPIEAMVVTKHKIRSAAFAPPGAPRKKGALCQLALSLANNAIEVVDLMQGAFEVSHRLEQAGHRSDVRALTLSSDDATLLSASNDCAKFWNPLTGVCLGTIESGYGLCALFAPGNRHAVVGTKEGTLEVMDLGACSRIHVESAHSGPVWSLAALPDRTGFVSGSADKQVKFWQWDSAVGEDGAKRVALRHVRTLKMADDVLCTCVSPDGKLLAVALLDSTIKVFFTDSLKFFLSLYGHKLPVLTMDISSDGTLLVSGSADKNIKIWGLDFGDCHKSLFAHQDAVTQVSFVHNTHYIFTAGKDKMLKYWDADRWELLLEMSGHMGEVWSLAVSTYGDFVVTGSHDRSIRRWERSQEPFFVEEEKEKRLESLFEADLEDKRVEKGAGEGDITAGDGAVAASGRKTLESLSAADSIVDALDMAANEVQKLKEFGAERARNPRAKAPAPNPLLLGLSPAAFVLKTLTGVKANDLEQALLLLPFTDALQLLGYLSGWLQQGTAVELASRAATLLLRIHHTQLVGTPGARHVLVRLHKRLRPALQGLKDTMGLNMAALTFLQRSRREEAGVSDADAILPAKRQLAAMES